MPDESSYSNNHGDILRSYHLDDVSEENVDALWRQLLVYKTFADNDVSGARARRVEAEATREQAQVEAIRSTQLMCARMKSEAELELQEASKVREKAHIALEDAHAEIEKSKEAKVQAEKERQKIIAEAQKKAQEIIDASQEIAQRETTQLRRQALTEVKAIMSRVQDMREAADEELETQKILSNIAKLKATSRWVMTEPEAGNNDLLPQEWAGDHASNGGASAHHESQHDSKSASAKEKKASKASKK